MISHKSMESIYKDVSNSQFTTAIQKMKEDPNIKKSKYFHAVMYLINNIFGFQSERDEEFQNLFDVVKKEDVAWFSLGEIVYCINSKNIIKNTVSSDESAFYVEQALSINPHCIDALVLYGKILWRKNRYRDAINDSHAKTPTFL